MAASFVVPRHRAPACIPALIAVLFAGSACGRDATFGLTDRDGLAANLGTTARDLKVAFIADQGNDADAVALLQLIRNEGADLVLHQGDFDYSDDPTRWDSTITSVLGADFPYFASVGNHDAARFYGPGGYQEQLAQRLARVPGASCTGDLGVNSACLYQGLFFILSGPGTLGTGHEVFIREALAADRSMWRICSWHKNQSAMQVGGKSDEVGWGPYEACRELGAIIATGHEHSYERTRTLINTALQTVDPAWPAPQRLRVARGATFVFVSGLGGASIRDQERCLPATYPYGCNGEWASIHTSNQGAQYGALFIEFHVDGEPDAARGYFKSIDGTVADEFTVTSHLAAPAANTAPVVHPIPDLHGDEGTSLALSAGFCDVDVTDLHSATIDWGDGSAEAGSVTEASGSGTVTGSHVYRDNGDFTVTVSVSDTGRGVGTDSLTVTVGNLPPISSAGSAYSGVEGTAIRFKGSAADPGSADVLTFEWDFQFDGVTFDSDATGPAVQHSYRQEGTHSAALRVSDDDGASSLSQAAVTVADADPVPGFTHAPSSPAVNEAVTFTDTSHSYDGVVRRHWSFGDGGSSSEPAPTHTYTAAGTYSVTLTVEEADRDSAAVARSLTVTAPPAAPVVHACTPGSAGRPAQLVLQVTGSDFQTGAVVSFAMGITVQRVTFVSPSRLDVGIKVHARTFPGSRRVTITNPDGRVGRKVDCLTVT